MSDLIWRKEYTYMTRVQILVSFNTCHFLSIKRNYQGQIHRRRSGRARAPFRNFWRILTACLHNMHKLYCNQQAKWMITMCILFSTLTTKHRVCVKGFQIYISRPKKLYRTGTAPPVKKFLDPPMITSKKYWIFMTFIKEWQNPLFLVNLRFIDQSTSLDDRVG